MFEIPVDGAIVNGVFLIAFILDITDADFRCVVTRMEDPRITSRGVLVVQPQHHRVSEISKLGMIEIDAFE
ncbi:hypothetical protein C485_00330 [Natrinema altunense JCM 12890]|uniref:Uncharacterized protein n=1 Tax=Natrinema altunense (strain JCM 12890 / CGMCC 1.3731 / AJ2) TaxID=1227494 RepID=L9ZZJ4_NATA2|nr:hypothetical protein C485_00330 [Natrinema altunense JCM 12890]